MPLPGAILTVFAAAALPALVLMTVWTVVAVMRLLYPEKPLPFMRLERPPLPGTVRVGAREIGARERAVERAPDRPYEYAGECRAALPDAWLDDLHDRRN